MTKPIKFTDEDREKIKKLAGYGLRDEDIANIFKIAEATLKKKFADELRIGRSEVIAKLGQRAFEKAMKGNTTMLCFLLKTRGRGQFKEVQYVSDESKKDEMSQHDFTKLSKDEREVLKKLLKKAFIQPTA